MKYSVFLKTLFAMSTIEDNEDIEYLIMYYLDVRK